MGKIGQILTLILGFISLVNAQTIKRSLLSANVLSFHNSIYVYGYEQSNANLKFKCFSYSTKLQAKDSIELNLGKHTPSDYLEISADTMHDVLNFYFQLANQKKCGEFTESK
jgi:trehalose-6-phosphate synthase